MAAHRSTERGGRKRKRGSVTWFKARSCYKVRLANKTLYLSDDKREAEAEAAVLRALWARLRASGHRVWPTGQPDRVAVRDSLGLSRDLALATTLGVDRLPPVVAVSAASITVGDAAALFLEEMAATTEAADRTVADQKQRLGRVLDAVGRSTPLASIGHAQLAAFVADLKAGKVPDRDGKPATLGRLYCRHLLQAYRGLLVWASEHDDLRWQRPARFDRLMRLGRERAKTEQDREAAKAKAWGEAEERFFTIDELRTLYAAADTQLRAFIMLGLNCAYYGSEAGALKASDLKVNGEVWAQTVRPKTGQRVRHPLWPETLAAMEAAKAPANPDGWLFLTRTGLPFKGAAINNLSGRWDKLRTKAGVPDAPAMKFLRHTSANEIKKIAGAEVSELHLGHAEGLKMQGPYTDRGWAAHAEAVKQLREVFAPVWAPATV